MELNNIMDYIYIVTDIILILLGGISIRKYYKDNDSGTLLLGVLAVCYSLISLYRIFIN
jgi:hypothetical protein